MVSYAMDIPKRVRYRNKRSYNSLVMYVVRRPQLSLTITTHAVPYPLHHVPFDPLLEGTQGSAGPLKVIWKGNILLLLNIAEVWKDTKFKVFPWSSSVLLFFGYFSVAKKPCGEGAQRS